MSGTFTLDTTPLSAIANNSLSLVEGVTEGFNTASTGIGDILGVFVLGIVVVVLLGAIFGIVFLIFQWITKLVGHPLMKMWV